MFAFKFRLFSFSFLLSFFLLWPAVPALAGEEIDPEQIEKLKSDILERAQPRETPPEVEIAAEDSSVEKSPFEESHAPQKKSGNTLDEDFLPVLLEDKTWGYDFTLQAFGDLPASVVQTDPEKSVAQFAVPKGESLNLSRLRSHQEVMLNGGSLANGGGEGNYSQQNLYIRPNIGAHYAAGRGYQQSKGGFNDRQGEVSLTRQFSGHTQGRLGFSYSDRASDDPSLHLSGETLTGTRGFYQANNAPLGGQNINYRIWSRYEFSSKSDQKFELLPYASQTKKILFHNESLYRVDPIHGDERERRQEGNGFGLRGIYHRLDRDHRVVIATAIDGQVSRQNRSLDIYATENRVRLQTMFRGDEYRTSVELALRQEIAWTDWLMTKAQVDMQWMQLDFAPTAVPSQFASGTRDELMLNPFAELNIKLGRRSTFLMRTGVSRSVNEFTSMFNNVRAAPFSGKKTNYEIGAESRGFSPRLSSSAVLFVEIEDPKYFLDESDLQVVQIQGQRRVGFELASRYQLLNSLYLSGAVSVARIKGAPKQDPFDSFTFQPTRRVKLGVELAPREGFFGGIGFSHLSEQVALDGSGLSVPGWWRLDAELGYRGRSWELQMAFLNLAGAQIWENPIARVTKQPQNTSPGTCGAGSSPVVNNGQFLGCEQVLFAPSPPIAVNASARVVF